MKILAIDPAGAALDWYMRCLDHGHKIKVWMKPGEKTEYIGKGIIDKVEDWRPHADWADMIFLADNTRYLDACDVLRKQGKCVIGPTKESSLWELDRGIGQEIFEKNGIETIPSEVFSNYQDAIKFVKKNMKRYVSKPSGDADKSLSYCSKGPEDMCFMLQRWERNNKLKGEFILQEFKGGVEFAVGGWIGPGGFNEYWCENFEFKKLMNDEKGVATGEQGTVLRYTKKSKLAERVLLPCEEDILATGHSGYVDVNCIIDGDNIYPLEWTMRNGYPTFDLQQCLHEGDPAEWMRDLAEGVDAENIIPNKITTGVVLTIPEYPYSHLTGKETSGIPIYGIDKYRDNIHPCEMMLGSAPHKVDGTIKDKKCLVTGGDYVLIATGVADTVSASSKAAYKVLDSLIVPNSPGFRTDIGKRLKKELPILQKDGFALGMEF